MEALYLLIPLSLVVLVIAIIVFIRMNMSGQFDEPDTAAWSILMDNDSTQDSSDKQFAKIDIDQNS